MRYPNFKLDMNGAGVRSIESLLAHFDPDLVLKYYSDGTPVRECTLKRWLIGQGSPQLWEAIESLDDTAPDFPKKLCQALGRDPGDFSFTVSSNAVRYEQEMLSRLLELTDDEAILAKADRIALTQDDLAYLYRIGAKHIILYAGVFRISLKQRGVTYGKIYPVYAVIEAEDHADYQASGITLSDIPFVWDVSGVTEQDEVFRAEQLMMHGNWADALPILQKSAEKQHPRALLLLEIYFSDTDKVKSQKSAEKGKNLGFLQSYLHSGYFLGKTEEALAVLGQMQDPLGRTLYGMALVNSGKEQQGLSLLKEEAENGSVWAQHQAGLLLEQKNPDESRQHFRSAAEQGFLPSIVKTVFLSDEAERAEWIAKAEAQGVTLDAPKLFQEGEIQHRNKHPAKAFQYYQQAAALHYAPAMMRLGCFLINGIGTKADPELGLSYCQKAAAMGDAPAFFALGLCYLHRMFAPENSEKALNCLEQAATQDYPPAYLVLADVFRFGWLNTQRFDEECRRRVEQAKLKGLSGRERYSPNELYLLPRDDSGRGYSPTLLRKPPDAANAAEGILESLYADRDKALPDALTVEPAKSEADAAGGAVQLPAEAFGELISYLSERIRASADYQSGTEEESGTIETDLCSGTLSLKLYVRLTRISGGVFSIFNRQKYSRAVLEQPVPACPVISPPQPGGQTEQQRGDESTEPFLHT